MIAFELKAVILGRHYVPSGIVIRTIEIRETLRKLRAGALLWIELTGPT